MAQTSDQSIVLLSIEFWSTICDIEITRKKEVGYIYIYDKITVLLMAQHTIHIEYYAHVFFC